MSKIKVKFLVDGKWMDEPRDPPFDVKAGDEREVSAQLANFAIEAGKAEFVKPKPLPKPKAEKSEAKKTGPTKKAETGPEKKAEG